MLYYDKTDVPEGTDVNEKVHQKSMMFANIAIFQIIVLKFQLNVCNNFLMMSINHNNIAILNIEGSDYCCIISLNTKNEATNLMQNTDLTGKCGTL